MNNWFCSAAIHLINNSLKFDGRYPLHLLLIQWKLSSTALKRSLCLPSIFNKLFTRHGTLETHMASLVFSDDISDVLKIIYRSVFFILAQIWKKCYFGTFLIIFLDVLLLNYYLQSREKNYFLRFFYIPLIFVKNKISRLGWKNKRVIFL